MKSRTAVTGSIAARMLRSFTWQVVYQSVKESQGKVDAGWLRTGMRETSRPDNSDLINAFVAEARPG